jgi:non-specific serine/threonine protein kinase
VRGRHRAPARCAALALRPNDANLLYNVACVFCTMNKPVDALTALKKSWALGMRDGSWARRDPDLGLLHGDPDFERLYPDSAAAV